MDSSPPPNAAVRDMWSCDTLEKASALVRASTSDGAPGLVLPNYIANEFTAGSAAQQQHIDTINPKTGRPFARVPVSSEADVDRALDAATEAFGAWSKTPASVRSAHLLRVAALLREHRELFAVWESIDQGKTLERARVEVDRAVANFNYFATFILHQQTAARVVDGSNVLTYEHRSAAGVFALISPWNMPLYLLTWKVAPCLAFGCTAVAKPSELTSATAVLLAEACRRAALPPGVVNLVLGDGPTTGAALVRSPRVRGVSFTGGTATGVQIRRATADQIGKHLSLELGGKNPTLVFDDVDLPRAVETAAMAAFENQGEICLCGSRIYVQSTIYDAFVEAFVAHVRAQYQVGQRVGAVVSRAHYDKVRGYLALARDEGATFALGGVPTAAPADGLWIAPAVLTGVAAASRVARDEIFGPVVTVAPFAAEAEAVALANDNPNGLAAVLLTRDAARIRRVGEQLDAGLVWANCWLVRELATPFGGMKQSGVGREGGEYSRDVFTNVRTLHIPM